MVIKILLVLMMLLSVACSSGTGPYQPRSWTQYHNSAGIEQYFLPDVPEWINYSTSGRCHRSENYRFVNIEKIRASFAFSYEQALQFQYLYNQRYKEMLAETKSDHLIFKVEEQLFYEISEKINANLKTFIAPQFRRINIVWIDQIFASDNQKKKLEDLMASEEMDTGHPIFLSLCLSGKSLLQYSKQLKLNSHDVRIIPVELFSIFDNQNIARPGFELHINELLGEEHEVHFYLPSDQMVPAEIKGQFIVHTY